MQWKGLVLMSGRMGVNMKATGRTILCMGKVYMLGLTGGNTTESM